jgi:hypothetical protein
MMGLRRMKSYLFTVCRKIREQTVEGRDASDVEMRFGREERWRVSKGEEGPIVKKLELEGTEYI